MRTRSEELEFQVKDIFNEFYKERLSKDKATSFVVTHNELEGMLDKSFCYEESGEFVHPEFDETIFFKILLKNKKRLLAFVKLSFKERW